MASPNPLITDPSTKDAATKDAAAKSRIVAHMNADHQDSLILYLQHHVHLSSFHARNAQLTDLSLSSLTIASSPRSIHSIPIQPPMESWSEARPRVVAMDKEARNALGRSDVTVKRYKAPRGFMTVAIVVCALVFVAFSRRANFVHGSFLYDYQLRYVPNFAAFCFRIQPLVIFPMVLVHGTEARIMVTRRLEKHTVRWGSGVWWLWVVGTFVEGWGSFYRFDEVVKEEELKKEKTKH